MHVPCNGINIGLDSSHGEINFLSHAHSDHTNGLRRLEQIISTNETIELAALKAKSTTHPSTKMIDAGHILGARQLVIEGDGVKTIYTGDFCTKPTIFGFKADLPQCDHLIMEATYGDPAYVMPPIEEVHDQIGKWLSSNPSSNLLFGCYELGKAQEVIKILNEFGVAPAVTEKTDRFCSVYEKYGLPLERVVVGSDEGEEVMSRPFAAIVPMSKAKRYFAARMAEAFQRKTLCAVVTGWALHYRFNTDNAFALSDHADFNDLVYFIEQSGAKKIDFFCGDGSKVLKAVKNEAILNS